MEGLVMKYYIACGKSVGPEFPNFYVSKETKVDKGKYTWKLGVYNPDIVKTDAWIFTRIEDAVVVQSELKLDNSIPSQYREASAILSIKE